MEENIIRGIPSNNLHSNTINNGYDNLTNEDEKDDSNATTTLTNISKGNGK